MDIRTFTGGSKENEDRNFDLEILHEVRLLLFKDLRFPVFRSEYTCGKATSPAVRPQLQASKQLADLQF
jgi:hypothetical protein